MALLGLILMTLGGIGVIIGKWATIGLSIAWALSFFVDALSMVTIGYPVTAAVGTILSIVATALGAIIAGEAVQ